MPIFQCGGKGMKGDVIGEIRDIFKEMYFSEEEIEIRLNGNRFRGDFSSNILFIFLQKLRRDKRIKSIEISKEGFVNFSLSNSFWQEKLEEILLGERVLKTVLPIRREEEKEIIKESYDRCISVLKHGERLFGKVIYSGCDISKLVSEEEILLIKQMTIEPVSLFNLCKQFIVLWEVDRGEVEMRFLSLREEEESKSRLALIYALTLVIVRGFSILGIKID